MFFVKKKNSSPPTRWQWLLLGIVILIAIFLVFFLPSEPTVKVVLNQKKFTMLLANKPALWFKGLSNRTSLGNNDGMLFIFPDETPRALVMRDMLFALDIIWFSGDTIVDIKKNAPLEEYKKDEDLVHYLPTKNADKVLEVPAGFVERNGINVHQKIIINF